MVQSTGVRGGKCYLWLFQPVMVFCVFMPIYLPYQVQNASALQIPPLHMCDVLAILHITFNVCVSYAAPRFGPFQVNEKNLFRSYIWGVSLCASQQIWTAMGKLWLFLSWTSQFKIGLAVWWQKCPVSMTMMKLFRTFILFYFFSPRVPPAVMRSSQFPLPFSHNQLMDG